MSACIEAYRATEDADWLNEARLAFEWFLGRNDLGWSCMTPAPAAATTACIRTASTKTRAPNRRLAFLLSLAEFQQLEGSLARVSPGRRGRAADVERQIVP